MEEETLIPPESQPPISEELDSDDDADHPTPDMPHQNPSSPPSHSDSDSGSDDDDDDNAQDKLQLQNLEAELSTNPSNYDSHVQVCQARGKFSISMAIYFFWIFFVVFILFLNSKMENAGVIYLFIFLFWLFCCICFAENKASEENGWDWEAQTSKGSYEWAVSVDPCYVAGMG